MQIESCPAAKRIGTVDIDSYRRDALMLREQTRTEFFRRHRARRSALHLGAWQLSSLTFRLASDVSMPAVAEVPEAIAARGEVLIATLHAVGAQVYECKADSDGETELAIPRTDCDAVHGREDGGAALRWPKLGNDRMAVPVRGKVAGQSPGESANDIPLLKLDATPWRGAGLLSAHHNGSTAQHPRWCRQRDLRATRPAHF